MLLCVWSGAVQRREYYDVIYSQTAETTHKQYVIMTQLYTFEFVRHHLLKKKMNSDIVNQLVWLHIHNPYDVTSIPKAKIQYLYS